MSTDYDWVRYDARTEADMDRAEAEAHDDWADDDHADAVQDAYERSLGWTHD